MPSNLVNVTGNFSHMEVAEKAQLQADPEAAALCTPSYFTLNSQVPTGQGRDGKACTGAPLTQSPVSPDSIHHPHHGLRLRLPP